MRKFLQYISVFLCFFGSAKADECETKYSAIVLDDKKNVVLYENRAEKLVYPASLTKVMTLYLTFDAIKKGKLRLNQKIDVSAYAEEISNINRITTLHLKEGDKISVRDAIRAVAVKSMNGVAVALSEAIAGDEWAFAKMMNEKAQKLKMFHTNFKNSTVLHDDGQYSTAYDLARLLIAIQKKFPRYKNVFAREEFVYDDKKFVTHNHFLVEYDGATGFKTGFTSMAGFNLMATAKRNRHALSGVIAGCETHEIRDEYSKEIFDHGFEVVKSQDYRKEMKVRLSSVF